MACIYLCVIILTLILIFATLLKPTLHFKYEIIGIDSIKSHISIRIFKFLIYKKEKQKSINKIISAYINNNKMKEKKFDLQISDTPVIISKIIQHISKEKIDVDICFGIRNSILPIYIIPILSTIISTYLSNNIKSKYMKNIKYAIHPQYYNTYILVDVIIKFKLLTLVKMWHFKNKYKEEKNGKSSN